MPTNLTPEQQAARRGKIAQWIAFAVAGFLFMPFAYATIGGMLALIICGSLSFVTWKFLPIFERKVMNMRLKALKAEAAANPVETLQNNEQRAAEALEKKKKGLIDFKAGVRSYANQVDSFKRRWPADGPKYDAILAQLRVTEVKFEEKYNQSLKNLQDFHLEIEKAEAEWNLGNTAAQARGVAMTQGDFDDIISTKTALTSVQLNLDRALSDLDDIDLTIDINHAAPAQPQAALPPATEPITIDVEGQPAQKARVRRN
jgi:hypothetical protein